VHAAVHHHTRGSGLQRHEALAAHTAGGYRAAGELSPLAGRLVPGAPASYTVWDGAPGDDDHARPPRCLRTAHRGVVLHDALPGVGLFAP
jgi:predicted amidohydrolase YtcJ